MTEASKFKTSLFESLDIYNFDIVSNFVLRISNLCVYPAMPLATRSPTSVVA